MEKLDAKMQYRAMVLSERTINEEIAKGKIAAESVIVIGVRTADIGFHTWEWYYRRTDVSWSLFDLSGSHIC